MKLLLMVGPRKRFLFLHNPVCARARYDLARFPWTLEVQLEATLSGSTIRDTHEGLLVLRRVRSVSPTIQWTSLAARAGGSAPGLRGLCLIKHLSHSYEMFAWHLWNSDDACPRKGGSSSISATLFSLLSTEVAVVRLVFAIFPRTRVGARSCRLVHSTVVHMCYLGRYTYSLCLDSPVAFVRKRIQTVKYVAIRCLFTSLSVI